MRSTGEVMGIDVDFSRAYCKAQLAAGQRLPTSGNVFISVRDSDKDAIVDIARDLVAMKYTVLSTGGTATHLEKAGVSVKRVNKVHEGRPHIGDMLRDGEIGMMVITSAGDAQDLVDGRQIRRTAVGLKVPLVTTIAGAKATAGAVRVLQRNDLKMDALQDFF